MGGVALLGLVLDVGDGNGDAPLPLLRRIVIAEGVQLGLAPQRQCLGDGRRQARLAVVDVPDRPHVHMRSFLVRANFCFPMVPSCLRLVTSI